MAGPNTRSAWRSTGASDTTEKLLGTVAKYVVNEAPADVFIVRPDIERTE